MNKFFFVVFFLIILSFFSINSAKSEYERKVVFEEFSEVWCGPCASLAPMLSAWLENHSDYIPIYYYSYFNIGGKKNYYSQNDYQALSDFYDVPFYPYARVNATVCPNDAYPGFPTDTNRINGVIDTMSKTSPIKLEIDFLNEVTSGTVKVKVTSEINLDNKNLFILLTDKHYTYEKQPNGQTSFHHIMRKMLPNGNGTTFSISAGETKEFEFDYTMDYPMNYDLYAIALVQDAATKYVYQAESVFKANPNSVDETKKYVDLQISPNPASELITVRFGNSTSPQLIEIYNPFGERIMAITNHTGLTTGQIDISALPQGVYILKTSGFVGKFVKVQ